jgi:hypothetical protein
VPGSHAGAPPGSPANLGEGWWVGVVGVGWRGVQGTRVGGTETAQFLSKAGYFSERHAAKDMSGRISAMYPPQQYSEE